MVLFRSVVGERICYVLLKVMHDLFSELSCKAMFIKEQEDGDYSDIVYKDFQKYTFSLQSVYFLSFTDEEQETETIRMILKLKYNV